MLIPVNLQEALKPMLSALMAPSKVGVSKSKHLLIKGINTALNAISASPMIHAACLFACRFSINARLVNTAIVQTQTYGVQRSPYISLARSSNSPPA